MSSRFTNHDTFLNHFNDLLAYFRPLKNLSWSRVVVIEQQSITWENPQFIPKSALISADEYEKRFDELLSMGYAWINMNAKGILENAFIVQVEFPLKSINAPRNKVSVNYSGPMIIDGKPLWDLSSKVKLLE